MTSTLRPDRTVEAEKRPGRWLALAVLVLAVLLVAVDATVLGLATPYISEDLRPSGTQLLWIGDIYSFVIAGLLVSAGSLGDRIGRKRLLLIGATAFGAVSVLNAYAATPETMIVARALAAGLVAGAAARRFSVRSVVAGGLAAIGLALALLTLVDGSTGYPLIGAALLVVGIGAGLSFTVTADVILSSVPKEQAGAASAVYETAYELGAALGIAVLGSIVTGVYRDFTAPAGTPPGDPRVPRGRGGGGINPAPRHRPGPADLRERLLRQRPHTRGSHRRPDPSDHGDSGMVPAPTPTPGKHPLGARGTATSPHQRMHAWRPVRPASWVSGGQRLESAA